MMRRILAIAVLLAAGSAGAACLFAQSPRTRQILDTGIRLIGQEEYDQAVLTFRNLLLDADAGSLKADAWFWLARTYLATGRLEEAERSLESFLTGYPEHPSFEEALYQKGRLMFLQKDYESAVQVLHGFLTRFPSSPFASHGWFWVGEALFALGQLDEAERMYLKVLQDFPRSVKVEAAGYKRSLIEFKRRENELLRLLKWSHEENLRTIEDFQRREKTYEQALAVYQRRLNELKTPEETSQPAPVGASGARLEGALEDRLRLVGLKEEALRLKEQVLERLSATTDNP